MDGIPSGALSKASYGNGSRHATVVDEEVLICPQSLLNRFRDAENTTELAVKAAQSEAETLRALIHLLNEKSRETIAEQRAWSEKVSNFAVLIIKSILGVGKDNIAGSGK